MICYLTTKRHPEHKDNVLGIKLQIFFYLLANPSVCLKLSPYAGSVYMCRYKVRIYIAAVWVWDDVSVCCSCPSPPWYWYALLKLQDWWPSGSFTYRWQWPGKRNLGYNREPVEQKGPRNRRRKCQEIGKGHHDGSTVAAITMAPRWHMRRRNVLQGPPTPLLLWILYICKVECIHPMCSQLHKTHKSAQSTYSTYSKFYVPC